MSKTRHRTDVFREGEHWRAKCSCRWISPFESPSRRDAENEADEHLLTMADEDDGR